MIETPTPHKKRDPWTPKDWWEIFYVVTLFLGFAGLILHLDIYRRTFIGMKLHVTVVFVVGCITFFIIRNHYKKIYANHPSIPYAERMVSFFRIDYHDFFAFAQAIMSFGFIACALIAPVNYYFAEAASSTFKVPVSHGTPGEFTEEMDPQFKFVFDGYDKTAIFSAYDWNTINKVDSATIVVRKGGLGYYIIDDCLLPDNSSKWGSRPH